MSCHICTMWVMEWPSSSSTCTRQAETKQHALLLREAKTKRYISKMAQSCLAAQGTWNSVCLSPDLAQADRLKTAGH